jgi:hypothetical protein
VLGGRPEWASYKRKHTGSVRARGSNSKRHFASARRRDARLLVVAHAYFGPHNPWSPRTSEPATIPRRRPRAQAHTPPQFHSLTLRGPVLSRSANFQLSSRSSTACSCWIYYFVTLSLFSKSAQPNLLAPSPMNLYLVPTAANSAYPPCMQTPVMI